MQIEVVFPIASPKQCRWSTAAVDDVTVLSSVPTITAIFIIFSNLPLRSIDCLYFKIE